jgi:hypothetical protein
MAKHPSLLSSLAHVLLHLSPSRSLAGGASENSMQSKNLMEGDHRGGEESSCEQREVAAVWQRRLLRETVRAMSTAVSSATAAACAIARSHPDVILGLCHAACSSTPCMYVHTYLCVCMYVHVCMHIRVWAWVCGCVGGWVVGWLGGWVGEWACVHTYISKGPAQEWARWRRGGRHGVLGAWLPGISGCAPQFEQSFRWACRRDVHVRGPDKSRTSVSAYFYYYVYYVYY